MKLMVQVESQIPYQGIKLHNLQYISYLRLRRLETPEQDWSEASFSRSRVTISWGQRKFFQH